MRPLPSSIASGALLAVLAAACGDASVPASDAAGRTPAASTDVEASEAPTASPTPRESVAAAPAEEPATFPPAAESLSHGGPTWAVYLAVDPEFRSEKYRVARQRLADAGYDVSVDDRAMGELGCDGGAREALGLDDDGAYLFVGMYFRTSDDAHQFADAWRDTYDDDVVGVAEVQTYCMD